MHERWLVPASPRTRQPQRLIKFIASFAVAEKVIGIGILSATLGVHPGATGNSTAVARRTLAEKPSSPHGADARIRQIIDSGRLSDLRWPDFSDYRAHVKSFYESSGYVWHGFVRTKLPR